ncbi:flippase-like domain-containing protein [bacterium]|nr:flippase-like domain-containing protein [bacterium]
MEAKTRTKLKNLLRFLLFITSLVILFFLLRGIGFDKLADAFVKVGWGGAVILICCGFLENGSDALGLYFALPKRKSFLYIFSSNCMGALTNYVIPWEVGELVKVGMIKSVAGSENSIKGVVLWNYVYKLSKGCALFAMVLLSLFFSLVMPDVSYKMDKFWLIAACSMLGFLPYFGMMILIKSNISVKIVKLLKLLGKKNSDELIKKAEQMDHDLKLFKKERPSDYRKTFWMQYFARHVSLLTFILCTYFAGFDSYAISVLILIHCAINLGNYISAFIPMKFGVGEGIGYIMFAFFGLPGEVGGLVTFILRIKAIIAMSIVSSLIIIPQTKEKNDKI